MADKMKRFNASKVRALGNLQSLSETQKRALRRERGLKQRWSLDTVRPSDVKTVREYLAPVKADFVPAKPRGRSGTRLSPEKRAMVAAKSVARREFFASLGVRV